MSRKKIIVILGTNASGKTKLAVKLANKFNGEIISADSRQVYKGMDIGTGKDLTEYIIKVQGTSNKVQVVKIPYHLIDIASPKSQFTVGRYQKLANKAIKDILKRDKLPIICGGTGFYIQSLVDGIVLPPKTSGQLRKRLNGLTLNQLLIKLKKLDPRAYKAIDKKNRRRVQRAVEVCLQTKKKFSSFKVIKSSDYEFLILGVTWPKAVLKKRIAKRLKERLEKENMIEEVKRLHQQGVSWKKLDEFGLEYRWIAKYLQNQISYEEMYERLKNDIYSFAKRQMTWFKKDKRIKWVRYYRQAEKLSRNFIK